MVELNLKSQLAFQFLIVVGILLFVFITFFAIISNRSSEENEGKLMLEAQDIANAVQKEIVIASTVLDGYSREFFIPSRIGINNYSISTSGSGNKTLVLTLQGNDFTKRIPYVIGQPRPGLNVIRKIQGEVYLN